jgi:lipopolysaccharide export LptBFGC system permease protein LptF
LDLIFSDIFGDNLVFGTYFGIMYLLGYTEFDEQYLPLVLDKLWYRFLSFIFFTPVVLFVMYAISDHFANFNKKALEVNTNIVFYYFFFIAQLTTVFLYMGKSYEYLLLLVLPNVIIIARGLRFLKNIG